MLLRSVCGGVRRFVLCFLGCLFSDPSVSKNVPERKICLRFPIQNPLEIVGCSERYQNQYQIDPRERFVTFSNAKSSRQLCVPRNDTKTNTKTTWASDSFTFSNSKSCRTRCVLQNDAETNAKSTRVSDPLRFPIQNRLEILVRSERHKNQYQIDPVERFVTFSNTNRLEIDVFSETIQKPIQNRPGRAIHHVFHCKIVSK